MKRVTAAEFKSLLVDDEADVQRRILIALADMGIVAWRCQSGAQLKVKGGRMNLAPPGTPDIIGYLPGGRMLAIEVKRPGEKVVPGGVQDLWHQRARAAGVACVVVDDHRAAIRFVQEELRK